MHSRFSARSLRPDRGFTLVELLVVIGIIAVLISILLPTLARARESANRAACLSNQRQILNAVILYANEHKGYLPGAAAPCVCDPRIVNAQSGVVLNAAHPDWSQMDVWNGGTYYSSRQLSTAALLQQYLGGIASYKVWVCPSSQEMFDNAVPTAASTYFAGKKTGFGYVVNDVKSWSSTYPSFLFGSYTSTNTADQQAPKKMNQITATIYLDPAAVVDALPIDPKTSVFVKDPTKVWLISDLDGRNFSSNDAMAFGIVTGASGDTVEIKNTRAWQPVHRNNKALPTSTTNSCGLGRIYGYLDGHASWVGYGDWPHSNGSVN